MLVILPLIEYTVVSSHRKQDKEITLHYNSLWKKFAVVPPVAALQLV